MSGLLSDLAQAALLSPPVLAASLILLSLALEDAALAAAIALVGLGVIAWPLALTAVTCGIAGGDMALYALGAWGRQAMVRSSVRGAKEGRFGRSALARILCDQQERLAHASGWLRRGLPLALVLARVTPGLRLPIYVGAGYCAAPWWRFAWLVGLMTLAWTGACFWLGLEAADALASLGGWSPPVAFTCVVAAFFLILAGVRKALSCLQPQRPLP
jgi:membrane protein DedA with SNARE-associated domain